MGNSYKNTSNGGGGKGDSGAHYMPIRDNVDPKPPAGASNSYEQVRKKIDARDTSALANKHYTREKMMNK
ncbi:MAG TPA: hypothetical protein VKZ95_00885 [Sphingobacteriaceae bacterium]|nr:hypothetical protein [Sphingobacteriaceae bacterium]